MGRVVAGSDRRFPVGDEGVIIRQSDYYKGVSYICNHIVLPHYGAYLPSALIELGLVSTL